MRTYSVCTAALVVAGIAAFPAAASERELGPAQGYYNDQGSLQPTFPEHLAGQPASRTRAFAPEPREPSTPVVPTWNEAGQNEAERRYDRSTPGPRTYYDQGEYVPADR